MKIIRKDRKDLDMLSAICMAFTFMALISLLCNCAPSNANVDLSDINRQMSETMGRVEALENRSNCDTTIINYVGIDPTSIPHLYIVNTKDSVNFLTYTDTLPPYQDTLPAHQDTIYIFPDTCTPEPIDTTASDGWPRIGLFSWGNANPEYCAKHDILITANVSQGEKAKRINPDLKIIYTKDMQYGAAIPDLPKQWLVRDTAGNIIPVYGDNYQLRDVTDFCPVIDGKNYREYFWDRMLSLASPEIWDGYSTDGLAEDPRGSRKKQNIDLDRNGLNDYIETGKGPGWIAKKWTAGNESSFVYLRERIGPDKSIITNSSRLDKIGVEHTNGKNVEHAEHEASFSYYRKQVDEFQVKAPRPWVCLYGATRSPTPDDYRYFLFHLSRSAYGDCFYFEFSDAGSGEHKYTYWMDEYDLDLGQPVGKMYNLKGNIWVRYFEKGVVIHYSSKDSESVCASELNGIYYHFQGTQNPVNDGSLFDQYTFKGRNWSSGYIGDGLILVNGKELEWGYEI